MRKPPWGPAMGVVAGLVVLLAPGTASAVTRPEYIVQADAVCAQSIQAESHALGGFTSDVKKHRLKRAVAKFRAAGIAIDSGIDGLTALQPPPEDGAQIASWIASLRGEIPIINRFAHALAKGQAGRLGKILTQFLTAAASSERLVEGYGFNVCNTFGQ
jgi:hypothetical protein